MRNTTRRIRNTRVLLALAVGAVLMPGAALAEAPAQQGWWSASSAPVPGLPAPAAAPDVPEDGLLVEGTASSPTAYAALSYVIPPGAVPDSLVLTVADGTATTPGASLTLHPLESPQFTAVQGGALANAPAYDAERSVSATVDEAGTTFTFDDLGPLELTLGVAVAVIPGDPGGRVVLSAPDETSLTTASDGAGSDFPTPAPPPSGGFDAGSGSGSGTGDVASGGFSDSFSLPGAASSDVFSSPQLAAALPPGSELPAVAEPAPADSAPVGELPVAVGFSPVAAESGSDGVKRFLAGLVILGAATAALLWAFAGGMEPDGSPLPS